MPRLQNCGPLTPEMTSGMMVEAWETLFIPSTPTSPSQPVCPARLLLRPDYYYSLAGRHSDTVTGDPFPSFVASLGLAESFVARDLNRYTNKDGIPSRVLSRCNHLSLSRYQRSFRERISSATFSSFSCSPPLQREDSIRSCQQADTSMKMLC